MRAQFVEAGNIIGHNRFPLGACQVKAGRHPCPVGKKFLARLRDCGSLPAIICSVHRCS